jgi:hypothetical protein
VSVDEQHVALPKLYGQPAYARPPRSFPAQARPLDVDELPIEAYRTDEDVQRWMEASEIMTSADGSDGSGQGQNGGSTDASFGLRSIGRIFGRS